MADKDSKQINDQNSKDKNTPTNNKKSSILTWLIMATVIIGLSCSGFVLGRLMAGSSLSNTEAEADVPVQDGTSTKTVQQENNGAKTMSEDSWYYNDLDSVVVNPDEPGATRFVRVGLILEMDAGLTKEKAAELIKKKHPLLINWLNLYFKSLSLDQMEDEKDMNHILAQISDSFNEILFPDAKPQIKRTLIREFNIQ